MSLSVTYFGMTADTTKKSSERFEFEGNETVADLRKRLIDQYPGLDKYEFKIAVDTHIVEDDSQLEDGALIALLPPFAGG